MARILVVDDHKFPREMLHSCFEMDDHEVTEARDGNEALIALKEGPYDLLVTDLDMPGMDGEALAIKAKTLYPTLPVVLHSGQREIARIASEVGAVGYIMKGTIGGVIRKEINRILAERAEIK